MSHGDVGASIEIGLEPFYIKVPYIKVPGLFSIII